MSDVSRVVVSASTQVLAHVPSLAPHGSKPRRELPKDPEVRARFVGALRSYDEAVAYPAHQAWLAALHPRALPARPWTGATAATSGVATAKARYGPAGEIMSEEEFLGLL